MRHTLISIIEPALKRYLALDPEALKRLAKLSGEVVKLEITDFNSSVYLFPNVNGIQLKHSYTGKIDAEIKGSVVTFIRLKFADEKNSTQLAKQLEISGDVHLAQTFSQILQQIDVDWEEQIAQLTGDIIAHQIGNFARSFKRWRKQAAASLQANITEYLQEEAQQLPPREEVEDFFTHVYELQNDLLRLEARLRIIHVAD